LIEATPFEVPVLMISPVSFSDVSCRSQISRSRTQNAHISE